MTSFKLKVHNNRKVKLLVISLIWLLAFTSVDTEVLLACFMDTDANLCESSHA